MNISQKDEFRYWYAGLALQAIIIARVTNKKDVVFDIVARESVNIADALIAELDKKGEAK